ncbi:SWI/SNF family DNA-dependent ATPase [Colletotrichum sojae]|uniref:SWI/SNF family DNA-dependent ATPase n=1 Tax=Colletotrichum sojae TaxID=2175907 RepID=A0A8H6IRG7_9PEZI|nr:SWI/SNF family DNA-dependent ATPase [Colletotrichum sojae]
MAIITCLPVRHFSFQVDVQFLLLSSASSVKSHIRTKHTKEQAYLLQNDDEEEEEEDADKNGNLKGFVVDDDIYNKISDTEDDSSPHPEPKPKPAKSKGKGKKKAKPRRRGDDKKRLKKIKGSMLQSLRKEAKKNAVTWRGTTEACNVGAPLEQVGWQVAFKICSLPQMPRC